MPIGIIHGSRTKLLAYLCLGLMAIFVVRLFYLQILQHGTYVALANQEQLKRLEIPAKRGEIFAMDGQTPVKLVLNQAVYTVFADPSIVSDPNGIIDTVKKIAGGNARSNLAGLLSEKNKRYAILATGVSRKQAELMKQKDLVGLGFQKTSQRVYPEGRLAAQTLGFVNAEGNGQYGLEGALNDELTGADGMLQSVTDVRNVPLTIGDRNINQPAQDGKNVVLTVDRNVQSYAEQALSRGLMRTGASKGSAIVLDPQTGKVLAMANLPTFSPAKYNKVQNPVAFNNGTITTPYEPGSVMKTFTSAIGVNENIISPKSTFNNTDYVNENGWEISNATLGQTGTITIQHALNWSLNTGFVTVARRLGDGENINRTARNTMYRYLHDKFQLGEKTGIELSGEQAGVIIPPTESEGNAVRYANMSFGQGMNLTMLQVAAGFSAIVNGGVYYSPTVVGGEIDADGNYRARAASAGSRVLSKAASKTTKNMIRDARAAFYSAQDKKGYDIGGKTGTSQTLIDGSYDNNQTVASYLGYGGDAKTPQYVIMVQVSSPGKTYEGNRDAMPIFTDISNWLLDYMKVQPKD